MTMFDDLVGSLTPLASVEMKLVLKTPFQSFVMESAKLTGDQIMELRAFVLACGDREDG